MSFHLTINFLNCHRLLVSIEIWNCFVRKGLVGGKYLSSRSYTVRPVPNMADSVLLAHSLGLCFLSRYIRTANVMIVPITVAKT
jgi:hypothetical protein